VWGLSMSGIDEPSWSEDTDAEDGMPPDWDDHAGWETYYAADVSQGREEGGTDRIEISEALRFTPYLMQQGARRVWFPGCGLDGCPRIYAALGLEVWASDVSPTAIACQSRLAEMPFEPLEARVSDLLQRYLPDYTTTSTGRLHALVHDFREPFPEGLFDCILNIKAFQALPCESMERAARVHFAALRPGGQALFDTMNVQGEYRNMMEDALIQAGFHIPYSGTERWYRSALAETGIPHLFVLGQPFVFRDDPRYNGRSGRRRAEADQRLFHSFVEEFERRLQAEAPAEEAVSRDPSKRVAFVVYNTG
jgi:hypothetical protein